MKATPASLRWTLNAVCLLCDCLSDLTTMHVTLVLNIYSFDCLHAYWIILWGYCIISDLHEQLNRAFVVVASRVWNSLPHHVTSTQSLPVFCSRLKTSLQTQFSLTILLCPRSDICHYGHINCYHLLTQQPFYAILLYRVLVSMPSKNWKVLILDSGDIQVQYCLHTWQHF